MEPCPEGGIELAGRPPAPFAGLQAHTLQAFTVLCALQNSYQRKLALCLGEDDFAAAMSLALLGLGGTCLMLDSDGKRLQSAGRSGAVDFTVSSLSEALRILKNEIRKGTAVSVGLNEVPANAIQEMLHRGVQPDLVCVSAGSEKIMEPFAGRGSMTVCLPPRLPAFASDWCFRCDEAFNLTERRDNDARMLKVVSTPLPHGTELDRIHRLWLKAAPRLFARERDRVYWSAG